jgi:hypothetical protein
MTDAMTARIDNPVCEGDDIPPPIRVFLYGDGYASIDGELSMSGGGMRADD